jgi:hypothetical protein
VFKKAKYICLALVLIVTAYELVVFAWSAIAEHKARRIAELVATLKPGYTTEDSAIALFQAHGLSVAVDGQVCSTATGPCKAMAVNVSNYPQAIYYPNPPEGISVIPLPPFNPAGLRVYLYFENGVLALIASKFYVGTTSVALSRYAPNYEIATSTWKYTNGGMAVSIGVASSGRNFDAPIPQFDLNYMYSVKCTDARTLWPNAPQPTEELHGWSGCR